ncbi:hypothetical protein F511_26730 [Dorcoceras hygrometricum]|uniref:Uncharacterized protein n=1 Tax=Dorcoceras hygrometricum TaxID=472368 RepID=A0A2Z7CM78_9LAMI|nr:hypothetical protein F511_26730 [Dorcoceras hygrometricum]
MTARSLAMQNLFRHWLTLLRTPSQTQPLEEVEEPFSTETSELQSTKQKQGRGEILKAVWCYFCGLDATIKIPLLVLTPLYLAVNVVYGSEVSKELTPLWILGPLLVALYIKMFRAICGLYVFSFKQTVKIVKSMPAYCLLAYDYIFQGKLKDGLRAHLWERVVHMKNTNYNEATKRILKDLQGWLLSSRLGLSDGWSFYTEPLRVIKVDSCQLTQRKLKGRVSLLRRPCILYATSEDESYNDLEPDNFEQESPNPPAKDDISEDTSSQLFERTLGKPGFISFYGHKQRSEDESPVSIPATNRSDLLWFIGPTVLVASFVFPSLYLRRILTTIFEDSLLTDFLILFFTEALFYCGVAGFLFLVDQLRRPLEPVFAPTNWNPAPYFGNRIASVAVLVLSLTIPMVTMGFVWPWTGPAASATLAPYLVGIIVQFAFEQYARYVNSPSWPAIPIIFQVYRLHQLNRAAQLVTALSFTVRGAEMTSHNVAINGSLSTLLNVLQFLGIICIWSLSSFIVRYFPSPTTPDRIWQLEQSWAQFQQPLGIYYGNIAYVQFYSHDQLVLYDPVGLALKNNAAPMEVNRMVIDLCPVTSLGISPSIMEEGHSL